MDVVILVYVSFDLHCFLENDTILIIFFLTNLQTLPKWLTQIFCNLLYPDAAHGPDGKGADQRVRVLAVLDKGIDGHDCHVRLGLGIVHQIQVHQLLKF